MEWERLTDQGAKWQNTDKWEPIFRSCLSLGHLTARFLWNIAIRSEFSEMDKNKKNLVDVYCLWVGEPPIAMSFKWTKTNKADVDTSEQVSRGMEFLEQHKIVHGDLAARWRTKNKQKTGTFKNGFSGTSFSLKKAQLQKCPTSASPTRCTPPLRSWTTPRLVFQFDGWRPRFWWIGRWVTWHVRWYLCTWQDIYILSFPGEQQKWHLVLWCSSLGSVQSRRCSLSWDRSNWPPVHSSKVAKLVTNGLEYFFLQDLNDGLRHLGNPLYKVKSLNWNIALTTHKYSKAILYKVEKVQKDLDEIRLSTLKVAQEER